MEYKSQISEKRQIKIREFPLLPGDHMFLRYRNGVRKAIVTEVGCANPEYVLGNPGDSEARIFHWDPDERDACREFLHRAHEPVRMRLKKSMWATLEFVMVRKKRGQEKVTKAFFTYEIMELFSSGKLTFAIPHVIYRESSKTPVSY